MATVQMYSASPLNNTSITIMNGLDDVCAALAMENKMHESCTSGLLD